MTSAGATSLVTGLSRHHSSFLQDPRSRPRPASPPRLPPHPRRHLCPPDRGHGLPGRSPLPPGHHRDQHRQDRAQATRPTGGHHQPQRPPNHCSAPAHPNRNQHPQIPQALRTLRHQESGQGSRPQPSLLAETLDKDLQAPAPSWPPTPGSLPSHAAPAHRSVVSTSPTAATRGSSAPCSPPPSPPLRSGPVSQAYYQRKRDQGKPPWARPSSPWPTAAS